MNLEYNKNTPQNLFSLHDDDLSFSQSIFGKRPTSKDYLEQTENKSSPNKTIRLSNGTPFNLKKKSKTKIRSEFFDKRSSLDGRSHYGIDIHNLLKTVDKSSNELSNQKSKQYTGTQLLCEQYRPKKWMDLIGSEKTHRFMLHWIMKWSTAVFKTAPTEVVGEDINPDPFNRPQKKILLIHGPPGIGKTTVAHIVAKHAGYDILEINASDERAGQIVRDKLKSIISTTRVDSKKPVCVIVDEVEGAAENGFIKVLVDIINSDAKASKFGSNKFNKFLMRPIIAICNDVYSPPLRSLRPLAEVIAYKRVSPVMIVDKLRSICLNEKIDADTRYLTRIANDTDCDMRSCLNMIQFGANTGNKDSQKSWTFVVSRIFTRDRKFTNKSAEMLEVAREINSSGEYDRIINSCFMMFSDISSDMVKTTSNFKNISYFLDWLQFHDTLNVEVYGKQHGSLTEYYEFAPLVCFNLFSSYSNASGKSQIFKSEVNYRDLQIHNKQLLDEFTQTISPSSRQAFLKSQLSQELLPYLVRMINFSTDSGVKDSKITNLTSIMNAFNLSLDLRLFDNNQITVQTGVGGNAYYLEPPITQLAVFGDKDQILTTVGNYQQRRLLHSELMKLGLSQRESSQQFTVKRYRGSEFAEKQQSLKKLTEPPAKKIKHDSSVLGLLNIQSLSSRQIEPALKVDMLTRNEKKVWVQYNEGVSNAVRRDVSWLEVFGEK